MNYSIKAVSVANSLKIQLMSDLHTEFLKDMIPNIKPVAPHLALLGDIGLMAEPHYSIYKHFLADVSKKFTTVLVILGNHEYYGSHVAQARRMAEEACSSLPNVILMQKKSILLDGIRVLGTTLWSSVPEDKVELVATSLNDYQTIFVTDVYTKQIRKLNVGDTNACFTDELNWIMDELELAKKSGETVAILTHHSPIADGSHPRFNNSPNNCAFTTDLEYLMGPPVAFWGFGHTHYVMDVIRNGTRVVTNAFGYVGTGQVKNFDAELVVEIKPL